LNTASAVVTMEAAVSISVAPKVLRD
jgi:hypothetical protein